MILESIEVRGWRCFAGPRKLGPLPHRLNVIHGPNGSGKSTLFEAVRHALLDVHTVRGAAIEKIVPWGRSLAPEVILELVVSGTRYRLTKRFLDHPRAFLERWEDGRFVAFQEGVAAGDFLRGILRCTPPGRGPARP